MEIYDGGKYTLFYCQIKALAWIHLYIDSMLSYTCQTVADLSATCNLFQPIFFLLYISGQLVVGPLVTISHKLCIISIITDLFAVLISLLVNTIIFFYIT